MEKRFEESQDSGEERKQYYEILQISENASKEVIEISYVQIPAHLTTHSAKS